MFARIFVGIVACLVAGLAPRTVHAQQDAAAQSPPNVLLICIDDLNTTIGAYGNTVVKTPNLDRLAKQSRLFERHYVHVAACGPSRSTLLSGKRQRVWDYATPWRKQLAKNPDMPEPVSPISLPHAFKKAGYRTLSIGKISHQPGGCVGNGMAVHEVPFSWDRAYAVVDQWETPNRLMFGYAGGEAYNVVAARNNPPRLPYEAADVPDTGYGDGLHADEAVKQLQQLSKQEQPFLLAVGFYRPHLPFNAPQKYWDLYDPADIPEPKWTTPSRNVDAAYTLHDSYEPTTHYHWPDGRGNINDEQAKTLRHAYYACVSYVDAQVGKVLDEVDRLGLDDNTIVVLWSDHGWHLGEHGIFGKFTNHEVSLRSPLIIRTPNLPQPGTSTAGIVETIDLYPTLADLCQLTPPEDLQGISLRPQLNDPKAPGKAAALGFVPHGQHLGTTLRTDRYRLTRWINNKTKETTLIELYDHQTDPNETNNIADQHPGLVQTLLDQLKKIDSE